VLLLDIAGPIEVLRKANLEQQKVRFEVAYVGPEPNALSSVGLELVGIAPLPAALPEGAWVVVPGSADEPLGARERAPKRDAAALETIARWLSKIVRPGIKLVSIC
jgi:transcriptional regulator GlxA family with amidase domain